MPNLRVSELFYSIQGEGRRAGEPSLFIRLQGCSAKHACLASGVVCDTEFESGAETSLDVLETRLVALGKAGGVSPDSRLPWIIWTGGEPLDQLQPEHVIHFKTRGFRQALETSGVRPLPLDFRKLFDWITVSPKVAEHILLRHFDGVLFNGCHVHELRYVRHTGQEVPQPSLTALHYCLSPHANGATLPAETVTHALGLCLAHPQWALSLQLHKVIGVL